MRDVKNIIEVLEAVEIVAIPAKQALKDGIDLSDIAKLLDIIKKYEVIIKAIDNAGDVVEEFKDIDAAEAAVIVAKVIEMIKKIKEA